MTVRILTGPHRNDLTKFRRLEFAGLRELGDWLNLQPRIPVGSFELDLPWFGVNSADLYGGPDSWGEQFDRTSIDTFAFATTDPTIAACFDDYERLTWRSPECRWIVTLLRLSRPVSWYGSRVIAGDICHPLGADSITRGAVELEHLEMLRAGERAIYHPGEPYFVLPDELMRRIYRNRMDAA